MKRKTLFSALAGSLLLSILIASCGDGGSESKTTEKVDAQGSAAVTEAETEEDILAYLPETDMNGWQMDILCHEDAHSGTWTFTASEMNGEVINDEIFQRTQRIQERYNMVYNCFAEGDQWNTLQQKLDVAVKAGDDAYDMVIYYNYALQASMVTGSYFYNMLEVPHLDFEKPWWHTEINDTFEHYGYLPCVLSDYSVNAYQYANLLVFNKVLAEAHDLGSLYDLVRNKQWTMDKFQEIVKNVTSDSNGDGKMDKSDTYGYATNFGYHALTWCYAIGEMGVTLDDEKGVQLGYKSEKFANMTEWLYEMLYTSGLTYEMPWDGGCDIDWDSNQILFQAVWLNDLELFREYDIAYGMLPYPMYDEAQEKYYTYDDCRCGAFGIPITSPKETINNTGLILEALSADSYHNLVPKYLDSVVTSKLSRDEDSLEMLEYIMDGRVYDIGYAIPDQKAYTWMVYNDLKRTQGIMTSTIEKNEKIATKFYTELLETYKELGEMDW